MARGLPDGPVPPNTSIALFITKQLKCEEPPGADMMSPVGRKRRHALACSNYYYDYYYYYYYY
eukprot:12811270-Heterocapsa_arctica.AAC.1